MMRRCLPPGSGQHLSEVAGPQEPVDWHIVEMLDVFVLVVQILDLPVPQMVDAVSVADRVLQLTLEQIGGHDVEQLLVVPKLSTLTRIAVRAWAGTAPGFATPSSSSNAGSA